MGESRPEPDVAARLVAIRHEIDGIATRAAQAPPDTRLRIDRPLRALRLAVSIPLDPALGDGTRTAGGRSVDELELDLRIVGGQLDLDVAADHQVFCETVRSLISAYRELADCATRQQSEPARLDLESSGTGTEGMVRSRITTVEHRLDQLDLAADRQAPTTRSGVLAALDDLRRAVE